MAITINVTTTGDQCPQLQAWAGNFTSDGTVTTIALGFKPQFVRVTNDTDAIIWEKSAGQAAANSIKITGTPTVTNDTGSAILISTDLHGNCTLTLSTTLCGSAKNICVLALG